MTPRSCGLGSDRPASRLCGHNTHAHSAHADDASVSRASTAARIVMEKVRAFIPWPPSANRRVMGQPNHAVRDLSGFTEEVGFPPPPLGAKVIRSSLTSHTTNIMIRSMSLERPIDYAVLTLPLRRAELN